MVESTRGGGCRRVVGPTRTIVTKGSPSLSTSSLSIFSSFFLLHSPTPTPLPLSLSHWLVLFLPLAFAFHPHTLSFCLSSRRAVAHGLACFAHFT